MGGGGGGTGKRGKETRREEGRRNGRWKGRDNEIGYIVCTRVLPAMQVRLTLYQPMTHIYASLAPISIYTGGLILSVNTLYRLFCFLKLFPMVGKGLNTSTATQPLTQPDKTYHIRTAHTAHTHMYTHSERAIEKHSPKVICHCKQRMMSSASLSFSMSLSTFTNSLHVFCSLPCPFSHSSNTDRHAPSGV